MSPTGATSKSFYSMESRGEMQDKIARLEQEVAKFKKENEELRLQLERRQDSQANGMLKVIVYIILAV